MLKYVFFAVLFFVFVVLVILGAHLIKVRSENKKELTQYLNLDIKTTKNLGKALVVYYSLSGKTREIAEKIQEKTNADIYEIKTKKQFSSFPGIYIEVKKQLSSKRYPDLEGELPDFSAYDLVFVGSPVWWYTISTPVLAFLEKADFKGKKVAPFSTQGSNAGAFETDFKALVKNAAILKFQKFNNVSKKYDKAIDNKIINWLNEL